MTDAVGSGRRVTDPVAWTPDEAQAVLAFWLRDTPPEQHFAQNNSLDAEICRRFGALHEYLSQRVPDSWREDPQALLAAVIVLDQFSRNLFRDDPRAYAQDETARGLTDIALARGDDARLGRIERQFLYMPLMHSEDAADQGRSLRLFESLGDAEAMAFARRHAETIARFGRFPARNAALGRSSTDDESAFLASHPLGF